MSFANRVNRSAPQSVADFGRTCQMGSKATCFRGLRFIEAQYSPWRVSLIALRFRWLAVRYDRRPTAPFMDRRRFMHARRG